MANNNDLWPVVRVNGSTHGYGFEPYARKNSPTIVATGSFPSKQRQLTTTSARGPWQLRKFQIPHRQLTRSIETHCVISISLLRLSYDDYRYIRTSNHRKLGQKGGILYVIAHPGADLTLRVFAASFIGLTRVWASKSKQANNI